jgi:two-component system sensor histidine kinase YesM
VFIALIIAFGISRSITNRLSAVISQMTKAKNKLPVALAETNRTDEVGELISTYNHMTHMIQDMAEKQTKAAEDLRVAEFSSLQAQINPHFLYNTMDMINWLSRSGRSEDVTQAIQKLSKFYKLTLSRKKSMSTVSDEIEHVTLYVELQNMRFHNMIDFVVDIPDYLMEQEIPKLTFQPIIENSILHGILEKEDKTGIITLAAWEDDDTLVFQIADDGIGMDNETLANILSSNVLKTPKKGTNIAVYNTHRRLQVLYGNQFGLHYSSTEKVGTTVEIRIPTRK